MQFYSKKDLKITQQRTLWDPSICILRSLSRNRKDPVSTGDQLLGYGSNPTSVKHRVVENEGVGNREPWTFHEQRSAPAKEVKFGPQSENLNCSEGSKNKG